MKKKKKSKYDFPCSSLIWALRPCLSRNGAVCSTIRETLNCQRTPDGNDRGDGRLASSPERGDCSFFAGSGYEAMTVGVSWVGWRSPIAPHGQQRRGYSGRTSERSRDLVVGRVTMVARGDEKLSVRRLCFFRGFPGGLGCAKGLRGSRCRCSGGLTSRNGGFSPVNAPTTRHQFAWPALVSWNMPRLSVRTPQIEDSTYLHDRCKKND